MNLVYNKEKKSARLFKPEILGKEKNFCKNSVQKENGVIYFCQEFNEK